MVLEIKLKKGREKGFKKHLEKEHPSTRGKIKIKNKNNKFQTTKQINKILSSVPNIKCQAHEFTDL